MKKVLETELLSMAHRILRMKNKDVDNLLNDAKNLYEKLLILKFYQDNFELGLIKDISQEELDQKLEQYSGQSMGLLAEQQRHQMPQDLLEQDYPLVIDGDKEELDHIQQLEKISPEVHFETPATKEVVYCFDQEMDVEKSKEDLDKKEVFDFLDKVEAEQELSEQEDSQGNNSLLVENIQDMSMEEQILVQDIISEANLAVESLQTLEAQQEFQNQVTSETDKFFAQEQERILEETRIAAEQAAFEEELLLEQEIAAEQEALEQERILEQEIAAEQARIAAEQEALEQERILEQEIAAEQARIAAEQEALEQERILEQEIAAEQARIAAEQAALEQERILEQEIVAEQARIAAEQAALEQERILEQEIAAEQARIAAEQAALEQTNALDQARLLIEREAIERERLAEMQRIQEEKDLEELIALEEQIKVESRESSHSSQAAFQDRREVNPFDGFNFMDLNFERVTDSQQQQESKDSTSFTQENPSTTSQDTLFNLESTSVTQPHIQKTKSINDIYNNTISVGLNDRIAFEKNLFGGSGEDFNRVLSQLNTVSSFAEAQSLIDHLVKPEYGNWEGKQEYEDRFMLIIEKRFN